MQNGPIVAVTNRGVTKFIDPETGETVHEGPRFDVERFVGGVPVSGLHRWSPDGRWIGGTLDQVPPGRPSLVCGDYHLVSSDGRTLSTIFVQGEHGWGSAAWSPDGRWLAIASESDDDRETRIDVSRVEDDGALSQGRRVVTLDIGSGIESLAWGFDGTLAWQSSDSDGERHAIGLLRPGSSEPGVIELGPVRLINPRWSSDGSVLAAVGVEGDDIVGRIYVVRPGDGTIRALDLPVHPISGKYAWDAEVPISSDGRIYFPAYGDPVAVHDVYSVNVDGTDLQNLTAEPADDGVDHPRPFNVMLSPDGTQIAFQSEVGVLLTVATGGGRVHAPLSQGPAQEVRWIPSWQPVP
jgi:Tol biopolymer transport system component